jgi:hypothetical protein
LEQYTKSRLTFIGWIYYHNLQGQVSWGDINIKSSSRDSLHARVVFSLTTLLVLKTHAYLLNYSWQVILLRSKIQHQIVEYHHFNTTIVLSKKLIDSWNKTKGYYNEMHSIYISWNRFFLTVCWICDSEIYLSMVKFLNTCKHTGRLWKHMTSLLLYSDCIS